MKWILDEKLLEFVPYWAPACHRISAPGASTFQCGNDIDRNKTTTTNTFMKQPDSEKHCCRKWTKKTRPSFGWCFIIYSSCRPYQSSWNVRRSLCRKHHECSHKWWRPWFCCYASSPVPEINSWMTKTCCWILNGRPYLQNAQLFSVSLVTTFVCVRICSEKNTVK